MCKAPGVAGEATGAEVLVEHVRREGISVCFANPGTTEMHIVDAFGGIGGVRPVLGLHENVVTGAADGYARMSRKPSMTLLHLGPGLSNGLANLHNAKRSGVPIFNVIGTMAIPHQDKEAPLKMDAAALAGTVSQLIEEPQTREELDAALNRCLDEMRTPTSPGTSRICTLLLAHDLQWQQAPMLDVTLPPMVDAAAARGGRMDAPGIAAAAISSLREAGARGAILLGGAALCEPWLSRVDAIAYAVGATLLCANGFSRVDRGRGRPAVQRIPYFPRDAHLELAKFDVIVLLDAIEPVAQFMYDDGLSLLVSKGTTTFSIYAADVDAALQRFSDELWPAGSSSLATRPPRVQPAPPRLPTGALSAAKMCTLVASLQPPDAIIVDESITSGTTYWQASDFSPQFSHLALTGGAIGQGPPLAVGCAIACPERRVINLQADGSGLYTAQALWTQAHERLNVTTIVCANNVYGILKTEMVKQKPKHGGNHREFAKALTEMTNPDISWEALAAGYGVPAVSVTSCDAFAAELKAALAADGPRMIVACLASPASKSSSTSSQASNPAAVARSASACRAEVPNVPVVPACPAAVEAANTTDVPLLLDPFLLLERSALAHPERTFFTQGRMQMDYGTVLNKTLHLAAYFHSRGVRAGQIIGVMANNRWEVLLMHFAAAAIGCALLNVNTRLSPSELAYIFADSEPTSCLVEDSFASSMNAALAESPEQSGLFAAGLLMLPTSNANAAELSGTWCMFDAALESGAAQASFEVYRSDNSEAGYQMYYTSGTTGRPKGVMLSRANVCRHAHSAIVEFGFAANDCWAHFAPLYHLVDAYAVYALTWVGGSHTLLPTWDARAALQILAEQRVSATHVAATMLQMLLTNPDRQTTRLDALRIISCGGSALPQPLVQQAFDAFGERFFTSYGMTECTGKISVSRLTSAMATSLPLEEKVKLVGTQGKPFHGMDVRILLQSGESAAVDEIGEVQVRGGTVFKGYWNKPDATASSFVDGWFCTGDLGRMDARGWLTLADRAKDMILFAGENVYSAEVERVLHEHQGVHMAAVLGVPDPSGQFGELVKAVVQLKQGVSLTTRELVNFCAASLARYKCPAIVEFVSEMPLTGTGKIQKSALRAMHGKTGGPAKAIEEKTCSTGELWRVGWKELGPLRSVTASSDAHWLVVTLLQHEAVGSLLAEFRSLLGETERLTVLHSTAAGSPPTIEECELAMQGAQMTEVVLLVAAETPLDFSTSALPVQTAFNACKALSSCGLDSTLRIVTVGAQPVDDESHALSKFEAHALFAWARSYAREVKSPVQCVDLCPHASTAQQAQMWMSALRHDPATTGEEVAIRRFRLLGPRLGPLRLPSGDDSGPSTRLQPDKSYVVTGALGGVGCHVIRWMLQCGARHLVLITRSQSTVEKRASMLDELRASEPSARLDVHVLDVGDGHAVQQLLGKVANDVAPIDGIFHLAGGLGDGFVRDLDWARCETVIGGKVDGAMHLHQASIDLDLQLTHFVLFSSVYALLGYAQLTHYAAANAALEGLALHRRASGLPAIAIQWGLWHDEHSMAPQSAGFIRRWQSQGMEYLEPAQGIACLDRLLSAGGSDAVVGAFPVRDWASFGKSPHAPTVALVEQLIAPPPVATGPNSMLAGSCAGHGRAAPTQANMVALVLDAVKTVTGNGACAATEPLADAGIDSLASVEFGTVLSEKLGGIELPGSLIFDYPTAAELAAHLVQVSAPERSDASAEIPTACGVWHPPTAAPIGKLLTESFSSPRLRCIVLHGEAADGEIMERQMKGTGWLDKLGHAVEFIFIEAPHACHPNPTLHAAMHKFGLYSKEEYRGWGMEPQQTYLQPSGTDAMATQSVQHVEELVKSHGNVDAICGICDGALVAACVAARSPFLLFLNFCSPPWDRLPTSLQDAPSIQGVSIHLIGDQDELYTDAQLAQVPARCRSAIVLRHSGGHVVPPLQNATSAVVNGVIDTARASISTRTITDEYVIDCAPVGTKAPNLYGVGLDDGKSPEDLEAAEDGIPDSLRAVVQSSNGGSHELSTEEAKAYHLQWLGMFAIVFLHCIEMDYLRITINTETTSVVAGGVLKYAGPFTSTTSILADFMLGLFVIAGVRDRRRPPTSLKSAAHLIGLTVLVGCFLLLLDILNHSGDVSWIAFNLAVYRCLFFTSALVPLPSWLPKWVVTGVPAAIALASTITCTALSCPWPLEATTINGGHPPGFSVYKLFTAEHLGMFWFFYHLPVPSTWCGDLPGGDWTSNEVATQLQIASKATLIRLVAALVLVGLVVSYAIAPLVIMPYDTNFRATEVPLAIWWAEFQFVDPSFQIAARCIGLVRALCTVMAIGYLAPGRSTYLSDLGKYSFVCLFVSLFLLLTLTMVVSPDWAYSIYQAGFFQPFPCAPAWVKWPFALLGAFLFQIVTSFGFGLTGPWSPPASLAPFFPAKATVRLPSIVLPSGGLRRYSIAWVLLLFLTLLGVMRNRSRQTEAHLCHPASERGLLGFQGDASVKLHPAAVSERQVNLMSGLIAQSQGGEARQTSKAATLQRVHSPGGKSKLNTMSVGSLTPPLADVLAGKTTTDTRSDILWHLPNMTSKGSIVRVVECFRDDMPSSQMASCIESEMASETARLDNSIMDPSHSSAPVVSNATISASVTNATISASVSSILPYGDYLFFQKYLVQEWDSGNWSTGGQSQDWIGDGVVGLVLSDDLRFDAAFGQDSHETFIPWRTRPICSSNLTSGTYVQERLDFYRGECAQNSVRTPVKRDRAFNRVPAGNCRLQTRQKAEEFQTAYITKLYEQRQAGTWPEDCYAGTSYNNLLVGWRPSNIAGIFYGDADGSHSSTLFAHEMQATMKRRFGQTVALIPLVAERGSSIHRSE